METITGQTFADCDVVLDGKHFERCSFTRCNFIFRGDEMCYFSNGCDFAHVVFKAEGAARNVIDFLRGLDLNGMSGFTDGLLNRRGPPIATKH